MSQEQKRIWRQVLGAHIQNTTAVHPLDMGKESSHKPIPKIIWGGVGLVSGILLLGLLRAIL